MARGGPQALTDHAAHGESHKMDPVQLQSVHQAHGICGQPIDGIRAGRHGRPAVAAMVVAQHAVPGSDQGGDLCIPHTQVRSQGMGHHHHRSRAGAIPLIVDGGIVDGHQRHRLLLCFQNLSQEHKTETGLQDWARTD